MGTPMKWSRKWFDFKTLLIYYNIAATLQEQQQNYKNIQICGAKMQSPLEVSNPPVSATNGSPNGSKESSLRPLSPSIGEK